MQKDLQRIADAAAKITKEEPATRAEYVKGLEKARKDQEDAEKEKDAAETEKEFDAAREKKKNAEDKEEFFKRQIDKIDFSMRMPEKEYLEHVAEAEKVVNAAVLAYQKKAEELMQELQAARADLLEVADDATRVLRYLDEAANVLQVKHRYRKYELLNAPPIMREDPAEWERHAIRFPAWKVHELCLVSQETAPQRDSVQSAAWEATRRAFPRRAF